MKILYPYWKKYRKQFLLAVLFVGMESVCDLFQPKLMSSLVDEGALTGSMKLVWHYGLMMLGVAILGMGTALLRNFISFRVALGFSADLRLDLFRKIQSLSCTDIDRFEEGSLVVRETNDVVQLQNFVSDLMRMAVKAPVVCIGSIFMAASMSRHFLPIIIPTVAVVLALIIISMLAAYPRFGRMQEALDRLNTEIREYLVGIRLVKAFRRLEYEQKRFDQANDDLTDETIGANRVLLTFSPFITIAVNVGIAAALFFGIGWVNRGELQAGQIMAFVTYMSGILSNVILISNSLNGFVRAKASYRRIAEVFAAVSETDAGRGREDLPPARTGTPFLVFDDVSFRYRGSTEEAALKNISFTLERGEKLGIIGPTGSGKSTLAALLLRFYDPTEGKIVMNGELLSCINLKTWRESTAYVPQTPVLFSGTLRENLCLGRKRASDEELMAAAEDAAIADFIASNPEGLNLSIGQSGGLSGGQKQRLSIARALLRSPELLVLDDCTSALDLSTEAKVRENLNRYSMTTICITQRISAAKACDRILVLENGHMVGLGTHEELLSGCEVYRDIYISQMGGGEHG